MPSSDEPIVEHAYKTYDLADVEVAVDLDDAPGRLILLVGGHHRRVHVEELERALVGDAPLFGWVDTDDHVSVRSLGDEVVFEASGAVGVPPAVARLDDEEVALMCEWLSELTELDWEG